MARRQPTTIPPFPPDIDRHRFGDWLSGLIDGEGFFSLTIWSSEKYPRPVPHALFGVGLRADDGEIVRQIQAFFGCGRLYFDRKSGPTQLKNTNPALTFRVNTVPDNHGIIIPHFERHPLRAKKRREFAIWCEAVDLAWQVMCRPWRSGGPHFGSLPKWEERDIDCFVALLKALKAQREYQAPAAVLPKKSPPQPGLFDGLSA